MKQIDMMFLPLRADIQKNIIVEIDESTTTNLRYILNLSRNLPHNTIYIQMLKILI